MNPLILLAPVIYFAATGHAALAAQQLDLSKVSAIRITGESSSIVLTSLEKEPYRATLSGRRTGWFANWYSSWFFSECATYSQMRIEDGTLYVDAGATSWLVPTDCVVRLNANVPSDASVTIEQAASQVNISGNYKAVAMDSKAADFLFQGHAQTFSLSGEAMRSRITLDRSDKSERVEIKAHSLDASIDFPAQTPISYKVESKASWVDSALPNSGEGATVAIRSEYARVNIR